MGTGEAEHHLAARGAVAVDALRYPRRQPLAENGHREHHGAHGERVGVENHAHVYHHAHADEEVGDEQRVAHKLDGAHKRRRRRHIAVEDKAGGKRAQHGLQAYQLRAPRGHEHHRHHEDILRHLLAVALEEPTREARDAVEHRRRPRHHLRQQPQHGQRTETAVARHTAHGCQHEQGAGHGYDGAHDGHEHRRRLGDAEAGGHGIGYERVRGVHGAEQQRCGPPQAQQEHRAEHA